MTLRDDRFADFLENKCGIDDLFATWKGSQDQADDATWVSFQLSN
jgi:hypothetical protein